VNLSDWLGSGNFASGSIAYLAYDHARLIVRSLKVNSTNEWKQIVKSGKLPINIPKSPHYYYKGKGWINWADFLGKNAN
jgi:hypothetical protein